MAKSHKQKRLASLQSKVRRGGNLTMAERLERQGLIFNHHGNIKLITIRIL